MPRGKLALYHRDAPFTVGVVHVGRVVDPRDGGEPTDLLAALGTDGFVGRAQVTPT